MKNFIESNLGRPVLIEYRGKSVYVIGSLPTNPEGLVLMYKDTGKLFTVNTQELYNELEQNKKDCVRINNMGIDTITDTISTFMDKRELQIVSTEEMIERISNMTGVCSEDIEIIPADLEGYVDTEQDEEYILSYFDVSGNVTLSIVPYKYEGDDTDGNFFGLYVTVGDKKEFIDYVSNKGDSLGNEDTWNEYTTNRNKSLVEKYFKK